MARMSCILIECILLVKVYRAVTRSSGGVDELKIEIEPNFETLHVGQEYLWPPDLV